MKESITTIPDASPLSRRLLVGGAGLAVAGAVLTAIALVTGVSDTQRTLFSLLINFAFFLSIALGALCWVTLHHLTRAGWSVTLRRMGEAIGSSANVLAVVGVIVLAFAPYLYQWANAEVAATDTLIQEKAAYLNQPFFALRYILYCAIWLSIARFFLVNSRRQDATGDPMRTVRMERFSPVAMILLGFSITFFAFDFLMSLDAHWFSTIFGVYYFAGALVAFFSVLALAAVGVRLMGGGPSPLISVEHLHDVGKLIFAFIVFWAYIAFSQYMLIWYANIPEETLWIARRQEGSWMTLTYTLLAGHFIIPFLGLMSRWPKRRPLLLAAWASWILAMHWLDLYWLIMPEYTRIAGADAGALHLTASDLTLLLTVGGLFLVGSALPLRRGALVPARDPRLEESLAFENI